MSTSYPSNLSDAEWEILRRYLPPLPERGRPPTHTLRSIFDAIFYVLRTGCPWRYLPSNFPPWQTVFYHFRRLRDPRHLVSLADGPAKYRTRTGWQGCTAECGDHGRGIRVKTVEESAGISGFDAHKCVKGRKRHILVDTLGLLLSVYVTPADFHDTKGARCLLAGLAPLLPRLKKIWADAAYRGQELAEWCLTQGNWDLEAVSRQPGTRGFSVLPRRWVVERTLSWISRNRRFSKDYERKVQTSETLIQAAMIRLLLARLGRST
jgi:putative transposase